MAGKVTPVCYGENNALWEHCTLGFCYPALWNTIWCSRPGRLGRLEPIPSKVSRLESTRVDLGQHESARSKLEPTSDAYRRSELPSCGARIWSAPKITCRQNFSIDRKRSQPSLSLVQPLKVRPVNRRRHSCAERPGRKQTFGCYTRCGQATWRYYISLRSLRMRLSRSKSFVVSC